MAECDAVLEICDSNRLSGIIIIIIIIKKKDSTEIEKQ